MKLGIMADSHDHLVMIERALAALRDAGCATLLHLGDFVAPFAMKRLLAWPGEFYCLFGNNDGEKEGLRRVCPGIRNGPVIFEISGRRLGCAHEREKIPPEYWRECHVVAYGHTHQRLVRLPEGERPALELNPGEVCGWLTGQPCCAALDLETWRAELLELGP